jgi:hypothetical protein
VHGLAGHYVAQQLAVLEHGRAGVVAARFDGEENHF